MAKILSSTWRSSLILQKSVQNLPLVLCTMYKSIMFSGNRMKHISSIKWNECLECLIFFVQAIAFAAQHSTFWNLGFSCRLQLGNQILSPKISHHDQSWWDLEFPKTWYVLLNTLKDQRISCMRTERILSDLMEINNGLKQLDTLPWLLFKV